MRLVNIREPCYKSASRFNPPGCRKLVDTTTRAQIVLIGRVKIALTNVAIFTMKIHRSSYYSRYHRGLKSSRFTMCCDVEQKPVANPYGEKLVAYRDPSRAFRVVLRRDRGRKKNNKLDECKVVGRQKERQKREQETVKVNRRQKKKREKRKTRRKRNQRKYDQNLSG